MRFQQILSKKVLSKLQRNIDYAAKDDAAKIKENEEIIDIVEGILYFNQLNQAGQGLKILTPNKMPSRLPISLAELNAGNNSEKLIYEIKQLLYSLYCSKKLTKEFITISSTLFKHGNNLYQH